MTNNFQVIVPKPIFGRTQFFFYEVFISPSYLSRHWLRVGDRSSVFSPQSHHETTSHRVQTFILHADVRKWTQSILYSTRQGQKRTQGYYMLLLNTSSKLKCTQVDIRLNGTESPNKWPISRILIYGYTSKVFRYSCIKLVSRTPRKKKLNPWIKSTSA